MRFNLNFNILLLLVCLICGTQISLASKPHYPTNWSFSGRIVAINHATKIIKVETPFNTLQNKVVSLTVTSDTMLSKESDVTAAELQLGDRLRGFGNPLYGISLGRDKPGTVIKLKPLTFKLQQWKTVTSVSGSPLEGLNNTSTSHMATFGNFGVMTMAEPGLTLSAMSAHHPGVFTVLDEKGAVFGLYSQIRFTDFAVGQSVTAVVSVRPKGQAERISIIKPKLRTSA